MNKSAKELLHSELMAMSDAQADELFRNFMKMKIAEFQAPSASAEVSNGASASAEVSNGDENWEKYNDENDWEQPDECCVCFELTSQKTNCNHSVCYSCMIKMTSCPLCRGKLIIPKNPNPNPLNEYEKKIKSLDRIGILRDEIKLLKMKIRNNRDFPIAFPYDKDELLSQIQLCEIRIREIQVERGR
jgi:hypothetical protein